MHASSGKIVPITGRRICNFLIKTPPRETGTLRLFAFFFSLSRAAGDDARRIIPSYARLLHIIYLPHLSVRIIIEIR